MAYRTDYHIHSIFSDGNSAPGDYIEPAKAAGLKEMGFSEHLTLFRGSPEWSMDSGKIESYISYIENLRSRTKDIIIRTGLEVDFFPGMEEKIYSVLSRFSFDYVLGSVHYLGEKTVDLGPDFYKGKDIDRLYENYFDNVAAAAASGLFDIIAHCDLVRIYNFRPGSDPEPLYRKLAKSFRQYDVAFEVNTNGRNRPVADFYPDRRYIGIFREENVPVCVNSDAHMPARVGQYFDEAYDLLLKAGYTEMAVFRNRERFMIPFS